MASERPDLNGLRLQGPGTGQVWLVMHGRRHHILNARAYDSLFGEIDNIVHYHELAAIEVGPQISEGAGLIQNEIDGRTYLVVEDENGEVRRHLVPDRAAMLTFGFDEARVRPVPGLVAEAITIGRDLAAHQSAKGDRPS